MPDPQKPAGGGKIPSNWKKLTGPSPRMIHDLPPLPDSYIEFKRKLRAEREKKFGGGDGGGGGGGDGGGGVDGGGDDEWGKPKGEAGGGGGGGEEPYVGPEPVGEDDAGSATGKGCSIGGHSGPPAPLGVAVLLGLMGLRRRRPAA
jgi:MYXO-CTERM domain-containing protein